MKAQGSLGACTPLSDTEAHAKSKCTFQVSAYITSANIPLPRENAMAKPKVKESGSHSPIMGLAQGLNI